MWEWTRSGKGTEVEVKHGLKCYDRDEVDGTLRNQEIVRLE